jgi:hypothetical protein
MRASRLALLLALAAFPSLAAADDAPKPNDSTLGAKPPEGADVLFDGKSLDGWVKDDGKTPAAWPVEDGVTVVGKGQGSIRTARKFGSIKLHVEFNVPLMPDAKGQARGNSGVYLDGAYELQVLDSYGLKPQSNDCGAIYQQVVPLYNACKPPLQWQTYDITFQKADVRDGKVVKKARITVIQNGIKIIDDAEISPTPGGTGTREGEDGPILLQNHGNDVQYRNIWAVPLSSSEAR